ncbi:MAG: EF-hand domain-containing protein [Steroidobacteraceae bacterium]
MISTISGGSSAWPSAACSQPAHSASSTGNLAQLETQLFASIDTNGNGSISQSELVNFMNTLTSANQSASASASATTGTGSLFNALDTSGGSGISLQDLQSNIGTLVSALRSQLATTHSPIASATGSAASNSMASSAIRGAQHRHHGHGHGGGRVNALLAALQQTTSGASRTSSTSAASTGTSPTTSLSVVA